MRWTLFPQTLDFDMILRQALSVYAHKQPRGLSKKLQNTECDYDLDQLLDLKYTILFDNRSFSIQRVVVQPQWPPLKWSLIY